MSKMHFHNISQEEMEIFLGNQGFVPIVIPDIYELVYAKIVKFESYILSLRVYSSSEPSSPTSGVPEVGDEGDELKIPSKTSNL